MPRQPRLDTPGALHHIIGRGIERTKIFRKEEDQIDCINRLADLCREGSIIVYAWALMSNHYHLLVRTGKKPISDSMRRLLTGYVVNFNRRHKRYGHLFQNRYKSIICEDDPYLLELTRYIHLNPLRAGIVGNMKGLKRYRWVGHSVIMGKVKSDWQDVETVLSYFGRRRKEATVKYEEFIRKGIGEGRRPDLTGGGLIRSTGRWSQVLSLRRRGIPISSDERMLGSSEFIERVLADANQREKDTLRLSREIPNLGEFAKKISERQNIKEAELLSGSRKKRVAEARKIFCQVVVKKAGYSGAEVARFLGISTSAVNRLANADEINL